MIQTSNHILLDWTNNLFEKKEFSFQSKLQQLCDKLKKEVAHFDWVGFYFANHQNQTLNLKAFSGIPTEHTSIPFGKGICGQVALSNQTLNVPDVKESQNYIACSLEVKSELVVPIFVDRINIGQIDIDSNTQNAFSSADEKLLASICEKIASHYIPL
tara:strand:+ start:765 stop:1238 length:474 start_codon:yes stop_codon:yes gene_type:complete